MSQGEPLHTLFFWWKSYTDSILEQAECRICSLNFTLIFESWRWSNSPRVLLYPRGHHSQEEIAIDRTMRLTQTCLREYDGSRGHTTEIKMAATWMRRVPIELQPRVWALSLVVSTRCAPWRNLTGTRVFRWHAETLCSTHVYYSGWCKGTERIKSVKILKCILTAVLGYRLVRWESSANQTR